MIDDPRCPACGVREWRALGRQSFRIADAEKAPELDRKRLRVLFEVWRPGTTELTVIIQACRRCDFVLYTPRPTEDDLDAKYRFLVQSDKAHQVEDGTPSNLWRARRLRKDLGRYATSDQPLRILHFGGGDGRLMMELIAQGHHCAVIDWCDQPVDGVEWLGAELDQLDPTRSFDIVVASHVLEHLAAPAKLLRQLRDALVPTGIAFIEVPLEIWRRLPRMSEPVTHVNFLVPRSLSCLLQSAGFEVLHCRKGWTRYGYRWERVVRAFARPAETSSVATLKSAAHGIDEFLKPSLCRRVWDRLLCPGSWGEVLRYRMTRALKHG
jgi:SAM-dependent methyltransferase